MKKEKSKPSSVRMMFNSNKSTSKEAVQFLLSQKNESRMLDFKSEFNPSLPQAWPEIIKDFVAMANSGGGYIIIGAKDSGEPLETDLKLMKSLDQAHYINQIHKYTSSNFGEIDVSFHTLMKFELALIKIGRSLPPIVFTKEGYYKTAEGRDKRVFPSGTIYTRHGSKSEPATQADIASWFISYFKEMKSDLLRNVRKVIAMPQDHTIISIPKEEYRITDNPNAKAVRLTNDPLAPEIPYKGTITREEYRSLSDELIGALRAWKTDHFAYTPLSQLWKFYIARDNLTFDDESLHCMLVSSMYNHCPIYYWASKMKRSNLETILKEESNRDEYPAINCIVRLSFAIGGLLGKTLLDFIYNNTKYSRGAKKMSKRLLDDLKNDKTIWDLYGKPKIDKISDGNQVIQYNVDEMKLVPQMFSNVITKLASQEITRGIVKRYDALLYGTFNR